MPGQLRAEGGARGSLVHVCLEDKEFEERGEVKPPLEKRKEAYRKTHRHMGS